MSQYREREPSPEEERREGIDPAVKGGHIGGSKGGVAAMESETISAAQLASYMKGIDFPADRRKLIDQARSNDAPDNIINVFKKLPDKEYQYPTDVEKEFGKMK